MYMEAYTWPQALPFLVYSTCMHAVCHRVVLSKGEGNATIPPPPNETLMDSYCTIPPCIERQQVNYLWRLKHHLNTIYLSVITYHSHNKWTHQYQWHPHGRSSLLPPYKFHNNVNFVHTHLSWDAIHITKNSPWSDAVLGNVSRNSLDKQ